MTAAHTLRRHPATTAGVVWIHASQRAMRTHLEWAVGHAVGDALRFVWQPQPAEPGAERAEVHWSGPVGTGAAIASALAGWRDVRFEVTEDPTPGSDGMRWMHTPQLGITAQRIDASGSIVVPEDRIRGAIDAAGTDGRRLLAALDDAMGGAWDRELETYRHASDAAPVIALHRVG
ncbi:DUF3145 family protein [Agrococcus carbonis]|uniref:DUF3145 domain-containing protein n=1 Tax=Agrococcus carbonis TaxID=684552 RepID=A0A1H1L0X8_9MICO|nr:DUF3145 family protein [Agrococcus carbonis]SDR68176.1 Protein of unknown function [Agrococcus carbonis]